MALSGNLDSGFGVQMNYHNIGYFSWNKQNNLMIQINSFVDENARINNASPLKSNQLIFSNVLQNDQISLTELYDLVKTNDLFSNMSNV